MRTAGIAANTTLMQNAISRRKPICSRSSAIGWLMCRLGGSRRKNAGSMIMASRWTKTTSAVTLAAVVRTVHAGGRHVDPELAAEAIAAGDSPLTPREADVLELAASGAPVDEIADRAALSPGTVRNYLSSAMNKLDAANRHEAAATARRMGWI